MLKKSSSTTPIGPAAVYSEKHISCFQQPLRPGPLSSPIILPFEIGTTIVNPEDGSTFELIQPLGNGSYAVVYMVREKLSNRLYALKCLSKVNLTDYHLDVQRNEALIHKNLLHPNVVKLDHYFETSDWLFLVLEYCEGQDLYYWLTQNNDSRDYKTGKQLSEKERIAIIEQVFLQILDAVGYCHSQGVAHRDLKPENFIVMINNDYDIRVKMTDFGLATDEKESVDFDCGSKPYMSYECRNPIHKSYDPFLADIWSLGIIFLNLMYHRSPWSDPNPAQCKSFSSFQRDKLGFLVHRFATLPENVARFLSRRVFCKAEEGRVSIKEWKAWCTNMTKKMSQANEVQDAGCDVAIQQRSSISKQSSSSYSRRRHGHNRHDSWSEVFGEFDNEMDFTAPVLFIDRKRSNKSLGKSKGVELSKMKSKDNCIELHELDTSVDLNANNSDADSGFGTDEDINCNIMKKVREKETITTVSGEDTNCIKMPLSASPPKIIYCKPRPWDEQRSRGHQREPSIESGPSPNIINNSHWSSYKQRRERLERRKHEQHSSTWVPNRRRGSLPADNETCESSQSPIDLAPPCRQRVYRPSYLGQDKDSTCITNSRPVACDKASPPFLRNQKSLKSNNTSISTSPPLLTPVMLASSQHSPKLTTISNPNTQLIPHYPKSLEMTPKKVARSTKTNLSKMLTGVVMFNRSVKVGGHDCGNM